MNYDLGDTALLRATFTSVDTLTLEDQTEISVDVRHPDGTVSTHPAGDLDHVSLGVYELQLVVDAPGDWSYRFVGDTDVIQHGFYVRPSVTSTDLFGRDLCSLRDVLRLVPGFDPADDDNGDIVETLANLISAESQSVHRETGREIVAIADTDVRIFDLTAAICQRRSIAIGDAATISQLELLDFDGTTSLGVVDANLYITLPRVRQEWEPIRRLQFPYRPGGLLRLAPGRTLVLTGTWGFPEIPLDLRQACAKRVLLRYVADNANAGTRLADAIDDTFSIGALLRSAREVVNSYSGPGFA